MPKDKILNCKISELKVGDICHGIKLIRIEELENTKRDCHLCWYNCPDCSKELSVQLRCFFYRGGGKCDTCKAIDCGNKLRRGSVKPLFEDNHIAYYYHGLIYSDGHLGHNPNAGGNGKNTFIISLQQKDGKYVQMFADFLGSKMRLMKTYGKNCKDQFRINISECSVVEKLAILMDINNGKKTYNPPRPSLFSEMNDEKRLSICVGFIDGDGCRCKMNKNFIIKVHVSWKDALASMFSGLYTRLKVEDYRPESVVCYIGIDGFNKLQSHRKKHNLPVFERKWYETKTRAEYEESLDRGVLI